MATEQEIVNAYPEDEFKYIMINQVTFLVLIDDSGERKRHFLQYPDGSIDPTELVAIISRDSQTLADRKDGKHVLVTKDGIHEGW